MFGVSNFLRPNKHSDANCMGYNDAWLGISNNNPYPINTPDYHQYEWGYNQAIDDVSELADAPIYYSSNEYEDWA